MPMDQPSQVRVAVSVPRAACTTPPRTTHQKTKSRHASGHATKIALRKHRRGIAQADAAPREHPGDSLVLAARLTAKIEPERAFM